MTSLLCWILLPLSFGDAVKMSLFPGTVRLDCKVTINCSLEADYADTQPDYDLELWSKQGNVWMLLASKNLSNGEFVKYEKSLEYDASELRDNFFSASFNATYSSNFTSYKCVLDIDKVERNLIFFSDTCKSSCQHPMQCFEECSSVSCLCAIDWEGSACNQTCSTSASISSEKSVIVEGERTYLSCQSDVAINFYWSKSSTCSTDSCKLSNQSDFVIEKSTIDDSGVWYCFAVNDLCTKRSNYTLTVNAQTAMNTVKRSTYGKGGVTSSGVVTEEITTIIDEAPIKANRFNPPPYWIIASSIFGGMAALVAIVVIIVIIAMNVKDGEDPEVFPEISDTIEVDQEDPVIRKPLKTSEKAKKKVEEDSFLTKLHNHDDKKEREQVSMPETVQKRLAVTSSLTSQFLQENLASAQAFVGLQESSSPAASGALNLMPQGRQSQITDPTSIMQQATTNIPLPQRPMMFPSSVSNQFYPDVVSQARQNTSQV